MIEIKQTNLELLYFRRASLGKSRHSIEQSLLLLGPNTK